MRHSHLQVSILAIKNNSYTAGLSQDHHLKLVFCERVGNGVKLAVSLDRIRKYVAYFWSQHLQKHFMEEEQLLFKSDDNVFCNKGKQDHIYITTEVEDIISGKSAGQHDFLHLIATIRQHISFEERVLFPHLELLLPKEELQIIQENLKQTHLNALTDTFSDQFWTEDEETTDTYRY